MAKKADKDEKKKKKISTPEPESKPADEKRNLKEELKKTHHILVIGEQEIAYTATAGTLLLKDKLGNEPKASIFFVAYTRDDVEDVNQRPITFSFNGGPGSSSVWLHMGVLGPRRVLMDDEGNPLPPPYELVNNEYSLLDETDLVFIDPVSTGYSRAATDEDAKAYHGVASDIASVGEFIRLYTSRFKRWSSPKFLIGESYGTTRASGLSAHLQQNLGMYLNGIMLISAILNFQSARFDLGNDLPYILFLPTYAAGAWFHKRLPDDLQQLSLEEFLDKVKQFTATEYTLALMKGSRLTTSEQAQVTTTLARYIGLTEDYVTRTNLRINIHRYTKELLRDERRTVGRFDLRFKGIDRDAAGELHDYDPSYAIVQGGYTAAFNAYVRTALKYKSDLPYEILTGNVQPWDFSMFQNQYVNVAEPLRQAMTRNPYLKVFVANGYFDLATPFFATEYTFDHLGLDPSLQKNVAMGYYEAGHMMYLHKASLVKLKADLAVFIKDALNNK